MVQRGLLRGVEAVEEWCVSRSSTHCKHLYLVSVIAEERIKSQFERKRSERVAESSGLLKAERKKPREQRLTFLSYC